MSMIGSTNVREYSYILKQRHRKNILFVFGFIFILFVLCTFWVRFILFPVFIRSESMNPTLGKNEIVFITPLASKKAKDEKNIPLLSFIFHCVKINRGDLIYVKPLSNKKLKKTEAFVDSLCKFVTFQQYSPLTTSHQTSLNASIRRVVGMPGDSIYMKDYVLYVKPADEAHFLTEFEIIDNKYDIFIDSLPASWDSSVGFAGNMDVTVLDKDEYFVLADSRSHFGDSRSWGVLKSEKIGGKLVLRYWPFNKISGM